MTERLVRHHELADGPRRDPGDDAREQQVPRQAPAPADKCRDDDQSDRPECADPVERREEGLQLAGERVEEVEDRTFARGHVPRVLRRDHQHDDPDHEPDPVARPALEVLFARPPEESIAPVLPTDPVVGAGLLRAGQRSHRGSMPRSGLAPASQRWTAATQSTPTLAQCVSSCSRSGSPSSPPRALRRPPLLRHRTAAYPTACSRRSHRRAAW